MSKQPDQFEIGKYYKHPGGGVIHIIGAVQTTLYGWCLVAEEHGSANLKPIGQGLEHTDNWVETTEEHWLSGFELNCPRPWFDDEGTDAY